MTLRALVAVCVVLAVAGWQPVTAENDRPIIGILTLPNYSTHYQSNGRSYFPASYVKWVESGGARVVPVKYTDSPDDIRALLHNLNGVLFTGGGADFFHANGSLTEFGNAGYTVVNEVVAMNKAGVHFPLWGTCLGFQLGSVMFAGANSTVLESGFDSENITLPLNYTPTGKASRMMEAAGADIVNLLATEPITMNNHHSGVTPTTYLTNPVLSKTFTLISTNSDRKGRVFASTVEANDMPVYMTQWHPEKVQFEWRPDEVIQHTQDAVTANSFFARFLVDEARKNDNGFDTVTDETAALIYNYPAVFTQEYEPSFEQCYYFK